MWRGDMHMEGMDDGMKVWRDRALLGFFCLFLLFPAFAGKSVQAFGNMQVGLFSWDIEAIREKGSREDLFSILFEINANEVYQSLRVDSARDFLMEAHQRGVRVYALSGQPEWGLDPKAGKMMKEVDLVVSLRRKLDGAGPAGLVLDVEPYLTKIYRNDPEQAMDTFVAAMRKTYAYAREAGVEVILCIPYFYDTKGFPDHLRALIEEASDAVAVMNYFKRTEAANIASEVSIARETGKRLINIAELQRPGTHDLTERNTYFREGLPAVWKSFEKLAGDFGYEGLSYALHDYTALREVIDRE